MLFRSAPSAIALESTAGPEVAASLRSRGHEVEVVEPRGGFGPVSIIVVEEGLRHGAPDPRVVVSGAAAT